MSKRFFIFSVCLLLLLSYVPVYAQGTAIGIKIGTLGAGAEVTKSITDKFNLRAGADFMTLSHSGETESADPVAYDFDLNMLAFSLLADYYPFNSMMRFSGGFVYNGMKIEGSGWALENYEFDSQEFTPEEIGVFTILAEPSLKFSPYVGLGFGNAVVSDKKINFILDIGIIYMGSPDITLDADENAMIYPTTEQEADVEEDLQNLKWYPIFNIGLSYKF